MPEKDTTNLPILDDIIVAGDADKAVHQPSSKVQSSLWSDDDAIDPSSLNIQVETDSPANIDNQPDISALFIEDQPENDSHDQADISAPAQPDQPPSADAVEDEPLPADNEDDQQCSIDTYDIDALTVAIRDSVMPELERLLTERIQQALKQHLSGQAGSS